MHRENLKFLLANQMQSIASYVLNTLLDKKFQYPSLNRTVQQSNCRDKLIQVSSAALKNEHWALKDSIAFDSNGELRSGVISGSIFNLVGDYDQCFDTKSKTETSNFKYCSIDFDISNEAYQFSLLTGKPINLFNTRQVKLGVCIPEICNTDEMHTITDQVLSTAQLSSISIKRIDCGIELSTVWYENFGLIVSLFMTIVLAGSCLVATVLHCSKDKRDSFSSKFASASRFIKVFSLIGGFEKLTEKRNTAGNSTLYELKALDGLRVLSMIWIIIVHSYNFAFDWLLFDNNQQVKDVYKFAWIQWIANGTFSVDNFFVISGFLAYFGHIQALKRAKETKRKVSDASSKLNTDLSLSSSIKARFEVISTRLVGRYLRLIPTLMMLIIISVNILPYIADGLNYSSSTMMFENWCQTRWHLNLFMLQNFIDTPRMCFSHSWFISVDFQLFIIMNLLLLFGDTVMYYVHKSINLIKWISATTMIIAQLVVVYIITKNDLTSIPLIPNQSTRSLINYYGLIYIKPYYWTFSYMTGVLLANCLTSSRFDTFRADFSSYSVRMFQLLPIISMSILLFSTLPYFQGTLIMSTLQSSIFGLLARPIWSLSLAGSLFFILIRKKSILKHQCLHIKLLRKILSNNVWLAFSRLTYAAYLIHPVVMAIFYGSRRETFQFSHSLLLYFTLGHLILTYLGAFIIYLMVEVPFRHLIEQIGKAIERKKLEARKVSTYSNQIGLSSLSDGSR